MVGEYRMGVGIFLLNKEKKLWVGKRIDFKTNFWQMPQGGIDYNETPKEAMIRELGEEVGIKKNYEIIDQTEHWLNYKIPQELKQKRSKIKTKNDNPYITTLMEGLSSGV